LLKRITQQWGRRRRLCEGKELRPVGVKMWGCGEFWHWRKAQVEERTEG
jgi:hypothetical protein